MRARSGRGVSPAEAGEGPDPSRDAGCNEQRLAALLVATRSTGVEDCRELLNMLGLAAAVGLPTVDPPARH